MGASSDPTPLKPGNSGGGKGPQFKTDAIPVSYTHLTLPTKA